MNDSKLNFPGNHNKPWERVDYELFMQAPVAICIVKCDDDYIVELANEGMLEILGRTPDIVGKPIIESLPEAKLQGLMDILDKVKNSRKPFSINTFPATLLINGEREQRYFDLVFKPYFQDPDNHSVCSIFCVAHNVTEQVNALNRLSESEFRYRRLIEDSSVATALYLGPRNIIQYANGLMLAYWNRDASVIGKPFREALPELEDQPFPSLLEEVFRTGNTYDGKNEEAKILFDGKLESFYFNYTFKALYDRAGNIYGIHHTAVDVTNEVHAKKKLEEEKERTNLAIAVGELGVFDLDLIKRTIQADDRFKMIFGIEEDWSLDKYLSLIHPDDFNEKAEIRWGIGNEGILEHELRIILKNGQLKWVRFRGHYYGDDAGTTSRLFGVIQDITKQKEFEQELAKMVNERTEELENKNRELQRSNQNLEEFAHVASHDLKQPIRKIQFFSERLKDQLRDRLTAEEMGLFNRIEVAGQRMGLLIDDLLLYSHVSQRPPEKEEIDLNEKVSKVLEDLEVEIQQKNAVVTVDKLPTIHGYRRQDQQLFQNLVSNALKYQRPGVAPEIHISSAVVDGNIPELNQSLDTAAERYYKIDISDNGIGFDPEQSEKIFKLFHRLHGNAEYGGTGVGLSIAQKVAENHGGKIIASSEEGNGATFSVFLPA